MTNPTSRLVAFAIVLSTLAGSPVDAFVESAIGSVEAGEVQPADDSWDFEDDEDATGWGDVVSRQALDLTLMAGFIGLALVSFARRSVTLKYVTLAVSVIYLGFMKSQLISIVNVFGLITGSLPVLEHSLAWYLFAAFALISTVLWGRLYCGRICAFGALTQLMDRVVPARLRVELPRSVERYGASVKYVLLAGTIAYFLVTRDTSIYRYVEPFWMFGRQATPGLWLGLGLLLLATIFIRNLYCRFLCPLGAALGLLSKLTVFRIKRWSECNTCRICEKACEWGAIRGPKILVTECVRCDDCERLYMDAQKCPHWIIIRRKSELMGRPSAAPATAANPGVPTR